MQGKFEYLQTELNEEGILFLSVNRPKANALGSPLMDELIHVFDQIGKRDDIKGVLVRSALEKIFCAGLDLAEMQSFLSEKDPRTHFRRYLFEKLGKVCFVAQLCPKPVAVSVNGHALAGGFVFCLAGDYVVFGTGKQPDGSTRSIKLGLTELTVGIPFPYEPLRVIERRVPLKVAHRLIFEASVLGSKEMFDLGVGEALSDDPDQTALDWLRTKLPCSEAFGRTKLEWFRTLTQNHPTPVQRDEWLDNLVTILASKL